MPSPATRRWLLVVSAILFVAWIGYLLYLVIETARPTVQLWPPRITKSQPVVLSRPQLLISTLDVIADVQARNGQPEPDVTIEAVQWPPSQQDRPAQKQIKVSNLVGCEGWKGPGRYILPLVKNGEEYRVARIPPSPGFEGGLPRIYPATAETERQLQSIQKPEPPG